MPILLRRPVAETRTEGVGRFERFALSENPFPSDPFVNKESADKRINGAIWEMAIRQQEYDHIKKYFLTQSQTSVNHFRLGLIMDTSYVGRGNGKTAFLVNLQDLINKDFCMDLSGEQNKCFAVYAAPLSGGRTKTFSAFVDLLFQSILRTSAIPTALATLRLDAVTELYPELSIAEDPDDEETIIRNLNSEEWYERKHVSLASIARSIRARDYISHLPSDFPLIGDGRLFDPLPRQEDLERHYWDDLRKAEDRINLVFNYLVYFFMAAGFNGAYIFIDDFERIPEFQSAGQKKDFALELRSCLFDGLNASARFGFYDLFLVLHAGVARLIDETWVASGMENRAPLNPTINSNHIIRFEKLTSEHTKLLVKKYLAEYRTDPPPQDPLFPFTEKAVVRIGEISEYNAARILKACYSLLDRASEDIRQARVDEAFVNQYRANGEDSGPKDARLLQDTSSVDLIKKAVGSV